MFWMAIGTKPEHVLAGNWDRAQMTSPNVSWLAIRTKPEPPVDDVIISLYRYVPDYIVGLVQPKPGGFWDLNTGPGLGGWFSHQAAKNLLEPI